MSPLRRALLQRAALAALATQVPRWAWSQERLRHDPFALGVASGDPTPSKEDCDITRRLIEAAKILGIRIVDHVICGRPSDMTPGFVSLREKNLVAFE